MIKIPSPRKVTYGGRTTYKLPYTIHYYEYSYGDGWTVWEQNGKVKDVKTEQEARRLAEKLYLEIRKHR